MRKYGLTWPKKKEEYIYEEALWTFNGNGSFLWVATSLSLALVPVLSIVLSDHHLTILYDILDFIPPVYFII